MLRDRCRISAPSFGHGYPSDLPVTKCHGVTAELGITLDKVRQPDRAGVIIHVDPNASRQPGPKLIGCLDLGVAFDERGTDLGPQSQVVCRKITKKLPASTSTRMKTVPPHDNARSGTLLSPHLANDRVDRAATSQK